MPLFGKKKKEEKEKSAKPQQAGQVAYPQGAYPQAAYPQAAYPQGAYGAPPQYYANNPDAPPSYGGNPPANYPRAPPGAVQANMAPPQYQPVQNTYMIQGGFDAGARFDGIAQPNVPPPPPGCAPNMAQMAAAQGHNVVMTQQQSNWFSGSGDGGYVIW